MAEPIIQSSYVVRLTMKLTAQDTSEAVTNFVENLTDKGLRDWIYQVEDPYDGEVLGYFDGNGEEITELRPDELLYPDESGPELVALARAEVEDVPLPEAEPEAETDAELLAVAEQANAEGQ